MALRIEEYALIGDCHTAALVGSDGSIDWLCLPEFDSGACFAALLGEPQHGYWKLSPAGKAATRRRYRGDTLVLETDFETDDGAVTVVDCMSPRTGEPSVVRVVVGRRGTVAMRMELVIRPDYGSIVPWVRHSGGRLRAIGGPDSYLLDTQAALHAENLTTTAEFTVQAGQRIPFVLSWHASHEPPPEPIDAWQAVAETEAWWREWSGRCNYDGPWRDAVLRSLVTLKALTYVPTGGIVAAATTSLPEKLGGVRNWDYRFCWVRDATFAFYALLHNGYTEEAAAWREWLLRSVAGDPAQMNIMYGISGQRRLPELELDWLGGYEGSRPVRTGNAAHKQFQLDVFGELMDSLHLARTSGLGGDGDAWHVQRLLMDFLEHGWQQPDEGIWEVRGPRRHFTHSKVMAWVAVDRMIRSAEGFQLDGPLDRWKALRQTIHDDVCKRGFDAQRHSFVQYYGAKDVDAALLMLPLVGFLPPDDPRIVGTVAAIEHDLLHDGFVARYPTHPGVDGLPPGEGAFLVCTFWLADNWALMGRKPEAQRLFERLLALRNDVGLLSEEYDPAARRLVGNFPQAFSHVGLINTARNLVNHGGAPHNRRSR